MAFMSIWRKILVLANNLKNSIHFYFHRIVGRSFAPFVASTNATGVWADDVHETSVRMPSFICPSQCCAIFAFFHSFVRSSFVHLWHQLSELNGEWGAIRRFAFVQSVQTFITIYLQSFFVIFALHHFEFDFTCSCCQRARLARLYDERVLRRRLYVSAIFSPANLILNRQRPHDKYRNGFYLLYPSRFVNITYDEKFTMWNVKKTW